MNTKDLEPLVLLSFEAMGVGTLFLFFLDASVPIVPVFCVLLVVLPLVLALFIPQTLELFEKHSIIIGVFYLFDIFPGVYTLIIDGVSDFGTLSCILNFVCCYLIMHLVVRKHSLCKIDS